MDFTERLNATTLLFAFCLTTIVWYITNQNATVYDAFPRIRDSAIRSIIWTSHVQNLVWKGYQNFTKPTGRPFAVRWWAKDFLILPPKYLPSLRDAEWTHLSFYRTISDAFFLHTSVGDLYDSDMTVQVVRKGLNPRIPQLTSIFEDEMEYAFKAELGKGTDWEIRNARNFFTAIIHRSASRIFIGEELCRNEKFICISTDFVMSIFITGLIIVRLPLGPLRKWLAYPLAAWHRRKLTQSTDMLIPMLQKRIKKRANYKGTKDQLDAIEWSLMLIPEAEEVDVKRLADELMHNLWAGTSAPGGLVTEIIFQLLLEPKYQEPLRNEAVEAMSSGGHWTEKALGNLPLLDSFIREINWCFPTGAITCSRTVLGKPYVFADGLTLPVGTRFGFPTKAMQNDADDTFDGFRFAKPNTASETEEEDTSISLGATAMSPANLAWGYGTHVCPGRFFAVRMIKMVVVTLLLKYDIQWDGQVDHRPSSTMIEGQFIPNLFQKVKTKPRTQVTSPSETRGSALNEEF